MKRKKKTEEYGLEDTNKQIRTNTSKIVEKYRKNSMKENLIQIEKEQEKQLKLKGPRMH